MVDLGLEQTKVGRTVTPPTPLLSPVNFSEWREELKRLDMHLVKLYLESPDGPRVGLIPTAEGGWRVLVRVVRKSSSVPGWASLVNWIFGIPVAPLGHTVCDL